MPALIRGLAYLYNCGQSQGLRSVDNVRTTFFYAPAPNSPQDTEQITKAQKTQKSYV